MNSVKELAEEYFDYAVSMRREFHMHPEPSMKEERTSRRIIEELEKLGLEAKNAAGTGVVCEIKGGKKSASNKTVALRADMDALELEEKNEVEYKSKNEGLMHGCGHDGHSASLLTAAKILNDLKEEFAGTVKLIFQPGEEIAVGAKTMVEEGVVEDVDAIFGIHIWNDLESGKISVEAGPRMAAVNQFIIKVKGEGGHGSMPHQGVDPIMAGAAIVMNLQTIVSREFNPMEPSVLSVDIFNSGSKGNVLPDSAHIEGTTRCFSREINHKFEGIIRRIAQETAESYRAEAELEYIKMTLPCINDQDISEIAQEAAAEFAGKDSLIKLDKTTGGEDFSFFAAEVPATFVFVGSRNEDKGADAPHHHPEFNIDEDSLKTASGLYAQFALDFLTEGEVE
ncbi:Catalyzes the cleavage of p-aminobenzoyl-glutamate to p-aminobenzoate and glutamate, subunit A [Halanaerobium saccharolyticum subsp. saccharolyticum DSM 6643]|uniref:Catalyzes the cleavage of p-aminobenzoyl-glutamate to p-aminobenzoate and glutamate, subunit A n=1 Tax=Halanaerobium saccharolyticum subsp. saccharolyticum DSM 6643 TaxID=1293054 RepID=M5DZ71_9FIRM|nr:M20 family metallopeptidase [Halanaerobium saccharolyticum]CCU78354.1 Catalyzes the cleavage of p-aminobenzoyl-glutamate to p-aminobenzoate and glutamate, subunit A [Halanaerobium saccharolyticum subsp. saccharolyticum DSM 6643]